MARPPEPTRKRAHDADDDMAMNPATKRQFNEDNNTSDEATKGAETLRSGRFSDFKIQCRQHVFNTHRLILSDKSPYFDRAIEGAFKESTSQELDLSAEEPVIVAIILWWIYTKSFRLRDMNSICELVNESKDSHLSNNYILLIKVQKLANYLMMHDLSRTIFRKLAELLRFYFVSLGRPRQDREMHRPLILRAISHLFDDNNESVEKVKELFAWVITIMNDRRSKLYALGDGHVDLLLEKHPALGGHLYRSMAAQARLEPKCFDCECLMLREKGERCLVVKHGDTSRWVQCVCAWRGLCSEGCYSEESKISRGGARCIGCIKGTDPAQIYQKRAFYWDDNRIKLVTEVDPNSQDVLNADADSTMAVVE